MQKPRDWHRFFRLWMARPKHRLKFKVLQWLLLRQHVLACDACKRLRDRMLDDKPFIGETPSPN